MKFFNNITLISLIAVNLAFPTVNDDVNPQSSDAIQDINAKGDITDPKLSTTKSGEFDDFTNYEEEPSDLEDLLKLRTIISGFRIPIIDSVIESTIRPLVEASIINPFNNIVGNNNYDQQTEEDMKEFISLLQKIKH
ncbi:hypothetical protein CONCODRAFT_11327 [Conidiobolus coronatus NRRL 28638]|uniref:Uncharacterized protein n=1 Tax=Conidiobolus coronatus (strain ATCC 28846 / CBS 209.66 / NRRL 28638) TaxID=796925 RepID=A0A137NVF0_CONC2|nr:hypothetical protein CONCODRAFT_11327 [Conidiobolus coronatus NRRL 28638]|eukprot:KXN66763.1 hypothetical protein CONCODRAFT_11327 [Conidiobolus coronatus NRRL 28638]